MSLTKLCVLSVTNIDKRSHGDFESTKQDVKCGETDGVRTEVAEYSLEIKCVTSVPVPGENYLDTFMPIKTIHILLIYHSGFSPLISLLPLTLPPQLLLIMSVTLRKISSSAVQYRNWEINVSLVSEVKTAELQACFVPVSL